MYNHLPLPCGEQKGLGGFGVALHPFSKGGKRDPAEHLVAIWSELSSAFVLFLTHSGLPFPAPGAGKKKVSCLLIVDYCYIKSLRKNCQRNRDGFAGFHTIS